MSHDFVRTTLSCAIEALLEEGSIRKRLSEADPYISKLENHRAEISDEWNEILKGIVKKMEDKLAQDYLSSEQELELAEELLELYVVATGGVVIF